jgi:hypothetical protein
VCLCVRACVRKVCLADIVGPRFTCAHCPGRLDCCFACSDDNAKLTAAHPTHDPATHAFQVGRTHPHTQVQVGAFARWNKQDTRRGPPRGHVQRATADPTSPELTRHPFACTSAVASPPSGSQIFFEDVSAAAVEGADPSAQPAPRTADSSSLGSGGGSGGGSGARGGQFRSGLHGILAAAEDGLLGSRATDLEPGGQRSRPSDRCNPS